MMQMHNWEPSVNQQCPHCDGPMEVCADGHCPLYRCIKDNQFFAVQRNGFLTEQAVRL